MIYFFKENGNKNKSIMDEVTAKRLAVVRHLYQQGLGFHKQVSLLMAYLSCLFMIV